MLLMQPTQEDLNIIQEQLGRAPRGVLEISYRTPDGHTVELERGRRVHVESGTVVLMGDRSLTITIGT